MNYIKKYYVVSLIIKNNNVYEHIIENKAAKVDLLIILLED